MKKGKEVVSKNLVFEIGSEELPATNLADIFETAAAEKSENPLLEKWKKIFKDNRISFGDAKVWATPRRLVFFLSLPAQPRSLLRQLPANLSQHDPPHT